MNLRQRRPRENDEDHLAFIRGLPCVICGNDIETQAAHVRFADARAAKEYTGKQQKPHDRWALPLCGRHHTLQHSMNEREWWGLAGVDPIFICLALSNVSGDHQAGCQIVSTCREAA